MKLVFSFLLISHLTLVCHARILPFIRSHHSIYEYETSPERIAHINAEYFFEKWLQQPTADSEEELMKQLLFLMNQFKNRIDTSAESDYWLLRQG